MNRAKKAYMVVMDEGDTNVYSVLADEQEVDGKNLFWNFTDANRVAAAKLRDQIKEMKAAVERLSRMKEKECVFVPADQAIPLGPRYLAKQAARQQARVIPPAPETQPVPEVREKPKQPEGIPAGANRLDYRPYICNKCSTAGTVADGTFKRESSAIVRCRCGTSNVRWNRA